MNTEQRVALKDCIEDVTSQIIKNARAIEHMLLSAVEVYIDPRIDDNTALVHMLGLISKDLENSAQKLGEARHSI